MKESNNDSLKSLIETVTKSKFPDWVKIIIVVAVVITPLFQALSPLLVAKIFADSLLKLFGF